MPYLFLHGKKTVLFGQKWRISAPGIVINNPKVIKFSCKSYVGHQKGRFRIVNYNPRCTYCPLVSKQYTLWLYALLNSLFFPVLKNSYHQIFTNKIHTFELLFYSCNNPESCIGGLTWWQWFLVFLVVFIIFATVLTLIYKKFKNFEWYVYFLHISYFSTKYTFVNPTPLKKTYSFDWPSLLNFKKSKLLFLIVCTRDCNFFLYFFCNTICRLFYHI